MDAYENTTAGRLILPNGDVIASGAVVELSEADLANAGVKGWIKSEKLAKAQAKPKFDKDK